ncbi:MAG: tRNA (adenosine(37)-N6)-threonylcarbamoyltransferase complex ATPase subunit type 1 TsaE [bacterium]
MEIITQSALQTQQTGRILSEEIIKSNFVRKKALVIGLCGELGAGKTTFIQGFAKGLGIKEQITSPTFVILKNYNIPCWSFYHIDCYRLTKSKDLIDLDFKEIINKPKNIIVIEWAGRVKKVLPKNTLWMKFEYLDKDKRKITL